MATRNALPAQDATNHQIAPARIDIKVAETEASTQILIDGVRAGVRRWDLLGLDVATIPEKTASGDWAVVVEG